MNRKILFIISILFLTVFWGCGDDKSENIVLQGEWISNCNESLIEDGLGSRVAFCKTQFSFKPDSSMHVGMICSNDENCISEEYDIQPLCEYEYVLGEKVQTVDGQPAQIMDLTYIHPEGGPTPAPSIIFNITGNNLYLGTINEDSTYTLNLDIPYTKI
ncbi:hypothetical protein JCM14469_26830 [Desulfatiferula olefinivorans]